MRLMQAKAAQGSNIEVSGSGIQTPHSLSRASILRIILSVMLADTQNSGPGKDNSAVVTPLRLSLKGVFEGLLRNEFDEEITIEGGLGIDSLARLSVIARLGRLFDLAKTGIDDYLLVEDSLNRWVDLILYHQSICRAQPAYTFQTSGSTGAQKSVTHELSGLTSEVDAFLRDVALGDRRRVVSLVPPHHIFGFIFSVLLPERTGIKVLDLSQFGPSAASRYSNAGDMIVGTAFHWSRLVELGARFPGDILGVTSGGRSNPSLWTDTNDLGISRLIDVYGSTETGGVGWRDKPHESFRLLSNFVCEKGQIKDTQGVKIDLQDTLSWNDEGMFQVSHRTDRCVKIGGMNISLGFVRDVILSSELFADIFLRVSNNRIKAFAIVSPNVTDIETVHARAIDFCNRNLQAPARPIQFTFGDSPPRNAMGKVQDW